jgi:hypothetical protein
MAVIGIDIDGVLASFEHGYAPLLTKASGIEFPRVGESGWPESWDWDVDAGTTKAQRSEAWAAIRADRAFWTNLPAHEGGPDFLKWLYQDRTHDDVYFVTSRPGELAKQQTEDWLYDFGYPGATVIISSEKGEVCHAVKADYYIDDKTENCQDVVVKSPSTKVYMCERAYNRPVYGLVGRGDIAGFRRIIEATQLVISALAQR